jgi:pyridinium-3,5-biscarboxylic acid mononucleotide sulfurtransferase
VISVSLWQKYLIGDYLINTTFQSIPPELVEKYQQLSEILRQMGSVIIGYSGGVDSSLLAWVANRVLGERMLAVTVRSPVESPEETHLAIELAQLGHFHHQVIDMDDLADPVFAANPPDRCFHCKLRRFHSLQTLAQERGFAWLADGTNADDANDYRPGLRALQQIGVRSPLAEAGLTKAEIRALAQSLGLPNWNKPAAPCLATRFPYNTRLTREEIERVGRAEAYLHELGFVQVRVRVHQDLARIETAPEYFAEFLKQREQIVAYLRQIGYAFVALDLLGYRIGSMNETLTEETGKLGRADY